MDKVFEFAFEYLKQDKEKFEKQFKIQREEFKQQFEAQREEAKAQVAGARSAHAQGNAQETVFPILLWLFH